MVEKKKSSLWLSRQLGCAPTTVSEWCTNSSQPPLEMLMKTAKLLDVELNDFVRFDEQYETKNKMENIKIPAGGMYQEWNCLMDLVEDNTAKTLELLANTKGWREVQVCEAKDMGFGELVEWSVPETDTLLLIDDNYLVCLHKRDLIMS